MITETLRHIYNHANGNENLFRSDENFRYFLQQWNKYISPIAETYAYCLMPNHFHFLIRMKDEKTVLDLQGFENLEGFDRYSKITSKHFSNLFNSYTKAFNKMYDRRGSLFIPNFKRKEIESDQYLTNIIFYIHHNPLHYGFSEHIADWPHSSYHALISDKMTVLQRKEVLQWFGSREELKTFHTQAIKGLENLETQFA